MAIPSVMQGLIEVEGGKVFELASPKGSAWLESVASFRYEPTTGNKPYTVRKESGKGGDYWYGYRKQDGKLHKKYIGRSSEVNTVKLEEIAEALNTPSQPRVTDKVTQVTYAVTDSSDFDRLTALELQVQALKESLEALRRELPGKSVLGNFEELPIVTDKELHIEVGNLRAEAEALKEEIARMRSQLATERADQEEIKTELEMVEAASQGWADIASQRDDTISELRSELADLKQKSANTRDLPEAADLLNRLKAKRKKSKADLADLEAILEILES